MLPDTLLAGVSKAADPPPAMWQPELPDNCLYLKKTLLQLALGLTKSQNETK